MWARRRTVVATRLMLIGESATSLALLAVVSLLLAWLYWREHRRARAMQAFFASVTHELRTPLTSIRLQAEAIAEGSSAQSLPRGCSKTRTAWNRRSIRRSSSLASRAADLARTVHSAAGVDFTLARRHCAGARAALDCARTWIGSAAHTG